MVEPVFNDIIPRTRAQRVSSTTAKGDYLQPQRFQLTNRPSCFLCHIGCDERQRIDRELKAS